MNRNLTSAIVVAVILFISASYVYVNNNPIEINIQATIGSTQVVTTSTTSTSTTSSTTTSSTTTSSTTTTTIPSTTTTIEVSEKDDSVTINTNSEEDEEMYKG